MKTETLIESLSRQSGPSKKLWSLRKQFLVWSMISAVTAAVGVMITGPRSDLFMQFSHPVFWFELVVWILLASLSALTALSLQFPRFERGGWLRILPLFTFFVWVAFFLYSFLNDYLHGLHGFFPQSVAYGCASSTILYGIVPAATLMVLARKGAPIDLGYLGALSVLSGASVASVGLHFCCGGKAIHVMFFHVIPIILVMLVGIWLGRRLLRW